MFLMGREEQGQPGAEGYWEKVARARKSCCMKTGRWS